MGGGSKAAGPGADRSIGGPVNDLRNQPGTTSGEVVWEYINPFFCDEPGRPGINNWVFRAFRYTPEEVAAARR